MDIITVIFDNKGHHRISTNKQGDKYETIVAKWEDDILVPCYKKGTFSNGKAESNHMAAIREVLEKNK